MGVRQTIEQQLLRLIYKIDKGEQRGTCKCMSGRFAG